MKLKNIDFSKYDRIFTFGCSFTSWQWPTWADILIYEFKLQNKIGENWGCAGSGNHFIFNSVIECDIKYRFNNKDLVVVQWSDITREDRYSLDKWISTHNEERKREVYGDDWVRTFHGDRRGVMIRDYAFIHAIQQLLEHKNCGWNNLSMSSITRIDPDKVPFYVLSKTVDKKFTELHTMAINGLDLSNEWVHSPDIVELYKPVLMNIEESFLNVVYNGTWNSSHPTPKQHLIFLEYVYKDLLLSKETYQFIYEWEKKSSEMETTNYFPNTIKRL